MDAFEYLAALMAVIVGLTIVHTLEGMGRIISDPGRYRLYWVHFLWAVWLLFYCTFFWWFEFALADMEVWEFGHFTQVLLYAAILYYIAVILFPRGDYFDGDFRTYYYRRRGWLMAGVIAGNLIDILDTHAKGPEHVSQLGIEYWLVVSSAILLTSLAWRFRQEWVQGMAVIVVLSWQISMTFRLFGTLA